MLEPLTALQVNVQFINVFNLRRNVRKYGNLYRRFHTGNMRCGNICLNPRRLITVSYNPIDNLPVLARGNCTCHGVGNHLPVLGVSKFHKLF